MSLELLAVMQPVGVDFGTVQTPATRSTPSPAMNSPTLRHVIAPALTAAGGQDTNAASAVSDALDALAMLESVTPGACVSFVGQLMAAAVSAPIEGGGELQQLRGLAGKLGEAVQRGRHSTSDPLSMMYVLLDYGAVSCHFVVGCIVSSCPEK